MKYIFDKNSEAAFDELDVIISKINTINIVSTNGVYTYENIHRVSKNTVLSGVDRIQSRGIYFRSWHEVDGYRNYGSHVIELFDTCTLDVQDNILTVDLGEGVDFMKLKSWSRKIPSEHKGRVRVTKEVAQMRMDELGYDFTIDMWENTYSPATIRCNVCDDVIKFKKGGAVYTLNDFGGFNGKCTGCRRYDFAISNVNEYKLKVERLKEKYNSGNMSEEDFIEKIDYIKERIEKELNIIETYREKVGMSPSSSEE